MVYNVNTEFIRRDNMTPEERLTLRIDPELKKAAQAKAAMEDLTLSQLVRRLLRQWLAEDPPESDPKQEG